MQRRRRRRKFNTSIEPAVAYENESVFMSGPVQQWPAIVHRHPLAEKIIKSIEVAGFENHEITPVEKSREIEKSTGMTRILAWGDRE